MCVCVCVCVGGGGVIREGVNGVFKTKIKKSCKLHD